MTSRRVALGFAWVATAVVSGALTAWWLSKPSDRDPPVASGERPATEAPPSETLGLQGSGPAQATVPAPRSETATTPPSEVPARDAGPAWIEVDVRGPDGTPVASGLAYALPAGAAGSDGPWSLPHANWPEERRIPVPAEALYDVGFVDGSNFALATDVWVRRGEVAKVRIALPPAAPLQVRWADGRPPRNDLQLTIDLVPVDLSARRAPGRREALRPSVLTPVLDSSAESSTTDPLPKHVRYRVEARLSEATVDPRGLWTVRPSDELEAEPSASIVSPGDTVSVRLVPLVPAVDLSYDVVAGDWPDMPVQVQVTVEQDTVRHLGGHRFVSYFDLADSLAKKLPRSFAARPGRAVLRWTGRPIQSGEAVLTVPQRAGLVQVVTIRCDPRMVASAEKVPVRIEGLPSDAVGSSSIRFHGWSADEKDPLETTSVAYASIEPGRPLELPAHFRFSRWVLAVADEQWASDPTPMPERGDLVLHLRPAHRVVVMLDDSWTERAGEVRVRHAGARPLGVLDRVRVSIAATVDLGSVLGPLPEGAHTFLVDVGGIPWPDVTVDVRSGSPRTLPIRP